MIKTIFYFKDTLPFEEYYEKWSNGEIADHTIVFVDDTKAIFKGGKQFGSTSDPDMTEKIINLIQENKYTLPIASSLVLGGIKVGEYLLIDNNGTLSVNTSALPLGNEEWDDSALLAKFNQLNSLLSSLLSTLSTKANSSDLNSLATKAQLNSVQADVDALEEAIAGMLSGSTVAVQQILSAGTHIATITINGLSTEIYAPDGGNSGSDDPENPSESYDDTELRNWLNSLNSKIDEAKQTLLDQIDALNSSLESLRGTANGIRSDLNSVINDLDNTIKTRIQLLFDDEEWVRTNFPDGFGSVSNFGEEDVQAYLQRIGLWEDSDNYTLTKWSTLYQDVDTLKFDVSKIITKNNGEYSISELFQSIINAYIDELVSGIEAGAMYARTDDLKNILEWMYSGLKAQSSPNLTYAQLISAAKNNELGTSAIAELRTQIQNLDGRYVAQSSLSTAVNDSLAALIQSVSDYSSLTLIINTIDANAENIAGLTTSVERLEGGIVSKAELLASVKDEVRNNTLNSGIRTEVDSRAGTVTNSIVGDIIDAQTGKVTAASLISSIINNNTSKTQLTNFITGVVNTNNNGETLDEIVESYVNTIMEASLLGSGWTTWALMVQGTISGLSALESRVGTLENGDWVTTANLGSKIADIDKGTSAWAGLVTTAKLAADIATAKSEMTSSVDSKIGTAMGGVYTKALTDSAISSASAALESSISGAYVKKASVITEVNNDTSEVKISADKINITGTAVFKAINGNNGNTTTIEGSKIKTGSITATLIDATNLKVTAANVTGKLTASQIDATSLQVAAANITGTLSASLINATGLLVAAANVTGKLTASQIDATSLLVSAANVTGTLSASKIDVSGVITAGIGYINNIVTDTLTGGSASFKGAVEATSFIAGNRNGVNVTTESDRVSFNSGSNSQAYFVQDDNGFQLYVYHDGDWYSINFSNWTNLNAPAYPSRSATLYKFVNGSSTVETSYVYFNNEVSPCYIDAEGTILASNSNRSGYYIEARDFGSDVKTGRIVFNHESKGYPYYVSSTFDYFIYVPVSFDNSGHIVISTPTMSNMYLAKIKSDNTWAFAIGSSSLQTVNSSNIYTWNSPRLEDNTLTQWAQYSGKTCDSSYQLYTTTESSIAEHPGHFSVFKIENDHWTAYNN